MSFDLIRPPGTIHASTFSVCLIELSKQEFKASWHVPKTFPCNFRHVYSIADPIIDFPVLFIAFDFAFGHHLQLLRLSLIVIRLDRILAKTVL